MSHRVYSLEIEVTAIDWNRYCADILRILQETALNAQPVLPLSVQAREHIFSKISKESCTGIAGRFAHHFACAGGVKLYYHATLAFCGTVCARTRKQMLHKLISESDHRSDKVPSRTLAKTCRPRLTRVSCQCKNERNQKWEHTQMTIIVADSRLDTCR